jgi:hypothetical protein
MPLSEEILVRHKRHPRILELRLAGMHSLFVHEYGSERATSFFKAIADLSRVNWTVISSVINRKDLISQISSRDLTRYRQEIVFMGACYGESRTSIGKRYLGLSRRMMYEYAENALDPRVFADENWIDGLNYTVSIAGVEAYRIEIERFLESLEKMGQVINDVPVAKVRV